MSAGVSMFLLVAMATVVSCNGGEEEHMRKWDRSSGNFSSDSWRSNQAGARHEAVRMARGGILHAMEWARAFLRPEATDGEVGRDDSAWNDCVKLYDESEYRLRRLLSPHEDDDARTWLSGALASHRTCLDGLRERGFSAPETAHSLTVLLGKALAVYRLKTHARGRPPSNVNQGLLVSWNADTSKADYVVAKDVSGNFNTINEAVNALVKMRPRPQRRVIIYVKAGVYNENVEIKRGIRNVMLVGDGIDRTIVTDARNVHDGATTLGSATFGVSGDGFWARDITFENAAGPARHQAAALRVSSDLSVFYRCSFKGYQDTLYVHSQRQFYRDCHVYGTIDFIFGDAAAVLQNCDIYVRKPLDNQANIITAQGRDNQNENTGISIQGSRVAPAPDLRAANGSCRSYLGRPWRKYSRTVFLKTDLDGIIDPKGWTEWRGEFALSTLFYSEYMNTGIGASTSSRVKWPGFHVLNNPQEAEPFTVSKFIQGDSWIPATGVPFLAGI